MQRSPLYTLIFATLVCVVCAVVVSSSAVSLRERQDANVLIERHKNVLQAAGILDPEAEITSEEVERLFHTVEAVPVELATGEVDESVDPDTYDQLAATSDPETSHPAPPNLAQVQRLPDVAVAYRVNDDAGNLKMVVLPIEGKGLWSTLRGFIALRDDLNTIQGITYYEHKETPGLGGEVDNPRWKARWEERRAFDDEGDVAIKVIKGRAGTPEEDPYDVDGLSGATLTSRGVTYMLDFWLGEDGFGPYLDKLGVDTPDLGVPDGVEGSNAALRGVDGQVDQPDLPADGSPAPGELDEEGNGGGSDRSDADSSDERSRS